jgi:hypothetical protein
VAAWGLPTFALAQPAPTAEDAPLLELPAFKAITPEKKAENITLELLPEEETEAAQPAPPPATEVTEPEPVTAPSLTAEPAAAEELPPPTPSAPPPVVVAAEAFGPPAPPTDLPESPSIETESLTENSTAALAPTDPAQDIINDGWNEGSLMFSDAEMQKLREALLAPPPAVVAVAPPPGSPPGTVAVPPPVIDYVAFYVNSIIYHSKDEWSVWLNGRKFFPGKKSPLERIKLKKVTDNQITFVWQPVGNFVPPKKFDKKHIRIKNNGKVYITLSANQTLLASSFAVFEGRGLTREIKMLIAENTAKAQLAAAPPAAGAQPANGDRANVDKLISQYRTAGVGNVPPATPNTVAPAITPTTQPKPSPPIATP